MMLEHLRHSILLLSAGLLFFSCSTDEPTASRLEMKFDISAVSRSAVTTAGNITRNPFAIFGDRIPTSYADLPAAERTIIYNNTPVTFINSSWTTAEAQYWYHQHEHSFVAIHPASVLAASDAHIQYLNNELSFTYILPSDPTQTADLLTATHRRRYIDQREHDKNGNLIAGTSTGPIYLQFGHIMSQINVAPAFYDNTLNDGAYIEVHKLELSGFKNKATFSVVPAYLQSGNQTDDRIVKVMSQEGEGMLTINFSTPKKVMNSQGGSTSLFGNDDSLIMLPQIFADNSEAKIILSYTLNGNGSMKQITVPLKNQKWESGKSYSYIVKLNRVGVTIDSEIQGWENEEKDFTAK